MDDNLERIECTNSPGELVVLTRDELDSVLSLVDLINWALVFDEDLFSTLTGSSILLFIAAHVAGRICRVLGR